MQRLPIAQLKIDRSFVRGLPDDVDSAAIVRATLSMAHDLGLRVVAEGVETDAQRDFLRQHGCDVFQGWLFARAMPAEELTVWLHAHTRARAGAPPG
ncbi:putative cyclic-di-GMP phosphodiesterase YjcC [Tepidimonas thermarum]|uniref:Putative cyclic-di-GMP phosphodiesterase YjcC n=1 Tax=Tepidimonas thermarum TaxID=335431 RepID=A0A554WTZ5_9BURK|nr:putative cyclic-di-GMP phosphodiesterase YjcC [Tepidimonas thermarum]